MARVVNEHMSLCTGMLRQFVSAVWTADDSEYKPLRHYALTCDVHAQFQILTFRTLHISALDANIRVSQEFHLLVCVLQRVFLGKDFILYSLWSQPTLPNFVLHCLGQRGPFAVWTRWLEELASESNSIQA